ncbi:MAG TPA: hypothetical protein ENO21_02310 [Firmicutes bacterium]|nr:hypothetical protein [Bacillota bacterium]
MVKVITDKRECHCSAFNYCIDENCTRWAEIVQGIGLRADGDEEQDPGRVEPRPVAPDQRY